MSAEIEPAFVVLSRWAWAKVRLQLLQEASKTNEDLEFHLLAQIKTYRHANRLKKALDLECRHDLDEPVEKELPL